MRRGPPSQRRCGSPSCRLFFSTAIRSATLLDLSAVDFLGAVRARFCLVAIIDSSVCCTVRDRLDYRFEDIGEQNVKNIARPVRVPQLAPTQRSALIGCNRQFPR